MEPLALMLKRKNGRGRVSACATLIAAARETQSSHQANADCGTHFG